MPYRIFADLTVVLHLIFVLFAVFGALLALKWRWVIWIHLPAVLWAAYIEFSGLICPLTPLENWFRFYAGELGYQGGFIEHYILPVLYPANLTHKIQIALGVMVIIINAGIYAVFLWRRIVAKKAPRIQ